MSGLAFVDTETTGLHPTLNPVWEIAVIVDDVEHNWQVQLPRDLPIGDVTTHDVPHMTEWVLEHTRWRNVYDDETAIHPQQSARRFAELVDGRHLVGAVPSFDEERLRALHIRFVSGPSTRMPWHYHLIDVEAMAIGALAARGMFFPLPWNSHDLSEALGVFVPAQDEHTALGDARWAKALYEAIVGIS